MGDDASVLPDIPDQADYEPRVVELAKHLTVTDDPNLPARTQVTKWQHEGIDFLEQAYRLDAIGYRLT